MLNHPASLTEQLSNALINKGPDYRPRTRYIDEAGSPLYTNRLILENSPYLLQHAHNPVDWYPWGEEAFATAQQQNRPVFLSIGYSTCHWCHVMEEESFDNIDVATVMNEHFICIKVDRELYPDIDTYYMTAVMMMQGHGGWPMSSFLTPDRKPFFGATYFRPGQFITLMHRVNELWRNQQNDLLEQAQHFSIQVADTMAARQSLNEIGSNVIDLTAQTLMNHYDETHGGFGQAPKFPNEPYLYFFLDYIKLREDKHILSALVRTLHVMACGGMYDQIGGGFHRYSTDPEWLVPHFEKMLYNQANLACVYVDAYQLSGDSDFRRIAEETLDYVLREMTATGGGFYSATDADSEGEEGLFFTWEEEEIDRLLGQHTDHFKHLFQVSTGGNFEGRNIPHLQQPLLQYGKDNGVQYEDLLEQLNSYRTILMQVRNARVAPLRDDKVITAWNGMMIKALARAGSRLKRQDYIEAASKAANYLLNTNKLGDDRLSRISMDQQASVPALQEDYAYLAEALVELYDATREEQWLQHAMSVTDSMLELFLDQKDGGFFMTCASSASLLPYIPKEMQDNATASGNSVALKLLARLWRRTGKQAYLQNAQALVRSFSDAITQRPYSSSYMINGLLELLAGEQDNRQWCGDGNIFVQCTSLYQEDSLMININVDCRTNWYLNALTGDNKEHVPITITLPEQWEIKTLVFPDAKEKSVDYQDTPALLYPNSTTIQLCLVNHVDTSESAIPGFIKLGIALQACTTDRCSAIEKLNLIVYTSH